MTHDPSSDEAPTPPVDPAAAADDSARAEARADWRCRVLLLLAVLIVWAPRLTAGPLDLRWDAGVYYVLGTSIAQGHGYRLLNELGAPEGVQYPPLLPALVAAHQLALGSSDPAVVGPWLRVTYFVLYALFALAAYALARRYLPPTLALLAALIPVAQSLTLILSDLLFAELPFALVGLLMAVRIDRARTQERPGADLLVGGLLGAAAVLLRTAGVALLAAWVGEAFLRRRWRHAAARAVVAALPVLAWQAHVARVQASDDWREPAYEYQRAPYQFYNVPYGRNMSLLDPFQPELGPATPAAVTLRTLGNAARIPYVFGESVSSVEAYWERIVFRSQQALGVKWVGAHVVVAPIFLLGLLTLFGQWLLARRDDRFGPTYVALSAAMVCATPWPAQFARYLIPVQPFLAIGVVIAARHLGAALTTAGRPRSARALLVGTGLLVGLVQAFSVQSALRYHVASPGTLNGVRRFNNDAGWNAVERAIDWVGRSSSPDAVVACVAPHNAWLRTGRHAVFVPFVDDPQEAQRLLEGVPISYVIVDQLGVLDMANRYALPAVLRHRERWRLAYQYDRTLVYERVAPGGR